MSEDIAPVGARGPGGVDPRTFLYAAPLDEQDGPELGHLGAERTFGLKAA
ncbi:hypothetical protein C5F59_007525 [Streptomyces sp. QL37]|nr:hypothetical protein [Streptomyces sp. QL37]